MLVNDVKIFTTTNPQEDCIFRQKRFVAGVIEIDCH